MQATRRTTATLSLIALHLAVLGFIFAHVFACAQSGTYATVLASPAQYMRDGLAAYTLLLILASGCLMNSLLDRVSALFVARPAGIGPRA